MRGKLVIACVGCTQIIGDKIGPIVGDRLIKEGIDAFVYGTTKRPITSKNLDEYNDFLTRYHRENIVVAIDACLGKKTSVGTVHCVKHGITPGKAVNPDAKSFGDFGILAVVAENVESPIEQLMAATEELVANLALKVVDIVLALVARFKLAA